MDTAAFTVIWVGLAFFMVLAGADFGVGVWLLAGGRSRRKEQLREAALGYFGPVWEINTLFLVFFLVGLIAAFPKAIAVLGTALMPLVLAALVMFVFRAGGYALMHYGPDPVHGPALTVFAVASVVAGVGLGYAATAPASGLITHDSLPGSFYTSFIALAAIPLALAGSAHLAAVVISAYASARERAGVDWYRRGGLISGVLVLPCAALFTVAVMDAAPYTKDRLTSPLAIPMVAGAVAIAIGLVALLRRRYTLAALLTASGYFAGVIGGAFAQYPYLVYPSLTVNEAAAPHQTLLAYLISTAVGGPLLLGALVVLYHLTLGPQRIAGSSDAVAR